MKPVHPNVMGLGQMIQRRPRAMPPCSVPRPIKNGLGQAALAGSPLVGIGIGIGVGIGLRDCDNRQDPGLVIAGIPRECGAFGQAQKCDPDRRHDGNPLLHDVGMFGIDQRYRLMQTGCLVPLGHAAADGHDIARHLARLDDTRPADFFQQAVGQCGIAQHGALGKCLDMG